MDGPLCSVSARFVSALNELEISGVQPRAQVSVIPFAASTYDEVYNEVDNVLA